MDVWRCDGEADCPDNSDEDEQLCGMCVYLVAVVVFIYLIHDLLFLPISTIESTLE